MFESTRKPTGTNYTATVALLAVAFVFNPALLLALRPIGSLTLSLVIACSLVCTALAWTTWKRLSHLSMSSIVGERNAEDAPDAE